MVSGEQNINVIGVEHLGKLLVHFIDLHQSKSFEWVTYLHLWAQWQSLNEEHRILKPGNIRHHLGFPNHLDHLLESTWDESAVRHNLDRDGRRCVHEEGYGALLTRVGDGKLGDQVALKVLETKLLMWRIDVNEVGANIDG